MPVYRLIPTGDLALSNDSPLRSTGIASLNAGGSLVEIEGVEQVRQRLVSRLRFFRGEWFLDLRQGIPYYRDVLVKNPRSPAIRSLFRRVILDTPGVLSLPRLDLVIDERARRGQLVFEAVVEGGKIVVTPGDKDFLVDLPVAA